MLPESAFAVGIEKKIAAVSHNAVADTFVAKVDLLRALNNLPKTCKKCLLLAEGTNTRNNPRNNARRIKSGEVAACNARNNGTEAHRLSTRKSQLKHDEWAYGIARPTWALVDLLSDQQAAIKALVNSNLTLCDALNSSNVVSLDTSASSSSWWKRAGTVQVVERLSDNANMPAKRRIAGHSRSGRDLAVIGAYSEKSHRWLFASRWWR